MTFFEQDSWYWWLLMGVVAALLTGYLASNVARVMVDRRYLFGDLYPGHQLVKTALIGCWGTLAFLLTLFVTAAYTLWWIYPWSPIYHLHYVSMAMLAATAYISWRTIRALRFFARTLREEGGRLRFVTKMVLNK